MPHISTVLIVDDDVTSRLMVGNLLAHEGYHLLLADSGQQALLLAAQTQPDIVLLDVMMPTIDGYETCRRLRADPQMGQVPIILLTALDDRASRIRGLEAGADDFVSKPFDTMELRTRVRTITRLNRFRQLFDERSRLEAAIEFSPDGVMLTDASGCILHANAAMRALTHIELKDKPRFFDLFSEKFSDEIRTKLLTLNAPGKKIGPVETELANPRKSGLLVEATIGCLPAKGGVNYQVIVRDVTDRKLMEIQIMRSERIDLLGQLAGGIVHDVNNLLGAIACSAGLLEDFIPEHQRQHLTNIQTSVQRGASLLRQILMFARGSDQELRPINPADVVLETANLAKGLVGRNSKVEVDLPPNEIGLVLADSSQLHQMLMNLCVNARDAMPEGGTLTLSQHRATLSAEAAERLERGAQGGSYLVLSVSDTGTGIPPDVRTHLFNPFFTTKAADKGTGLGLATVLRLVRRHRGIITVDTEVGVGTRFSIYLPNIMDL